MQTTAIDQESGQIRNTTLLAHIASFSSAIRLGQKIEKDSQCLCRIGAKHRHPFAQNIFMNILGQVQLGPLYPGALSPA
jgi:hypothetical protein